MYNRKNLRLFPLVKTSSLQTKLHLYYSDKLIDFSLRLIVASDCTNKVFTLTCMVSGHVNLLEQKKALTQEIVQLPPLFRHQHGSLRRRRKFTCKLP